MNSPTPKPRSTRGYLNNFRDPLGLAKRMLLSANPAAYWSLSREALRPVVRPLDMLMSRRERRLLDTPRELNHPILLVVGPPRSGTTVLYQLLASTMETTWFPNVSEMFPRAPISATRMFTRNRAARGMSSFYGQTPGLSSPNDGFHVWNRWLGDDRYEPTLRPGAEQQMLQFLATWTHTFNRPLLNKNNRNTLAMAALSRVLPNAKFVVLTREPSDIVRSLIRAREFVQGSRSRAWGLAAMETDDESDPLRYVDDVCDQVGSIEERLRQELCETDASRVFEVDFDKMCESPLAALRAIAALADIPLRPNCEAATQQLKQPIRRPLTDGEEQRIAECLDQNGGVTNTSSSNRDPFCLPSA